jgi:GNAT superfamily N-acetyltransferase
VIRIRRATLADRTAIHAVHTASIRELCSTHYSADEIARWAGFLAPEHYTAVIEDATRRIVVAEIRGEIVGFGQANLAEGEIEAVYVRPDNAGTGIGRSILRYFEDLAIDAKLPSLRLTATLNAVPFYQRQGFALVAQGQHHHPSGVVLRCASMTKALGVG